MDPDQRLISVVCGAVQHQAQHAGLEPEAGDLLARAAGDVCRGIISELSGNGESLDVAVDTFSDRIEIGIHGRGQTIPPVGLEMFAAPAKSGRINGVELLSRVDRVLYNAENGVARTTLVKFLPAHGPNALTHS